MTQSRTLSVDGKNHQVDVDDPDMPLLFVLRDELGMNNPRFGCGLGQCGACTVHVDGQPARSCVTPLSSVQNAAVTTLAGIGTEERPHPLQVAWVAEEASQCGYCISGWLMTAVALLRENSQPTDAQIREKLGGLKCRCGTHVAMIRAIKRASKMMAGAQQ
jgi:aerobic-type carbon monoxide dehydrogenase small subunit (CoxS/CutS family)